MSEGTSIKVKGKDIILKELTVSEVREWIKSEIALEQKREGTEDSEFDWVGEWLIDDIPLRILTMMSSLESDELGDMLPSDLSKVVEGCKEVNSYFFALRSRILGLGKIALEKQILENS